MTCFYTRSTILLILLVTLAALVHSHPNGPDDFEHMDFAWVANMGSHFDAAVAHAQFAQMTTSPMTGSSRTSTSPRPPLRSQHQSYQQPQPRSHPTPASTTMDAYFPPFGTQYAAYKNEPASREVSPATNQTSHIPLQVYERSATPNSFQDGTSGTRRSLISQMAHRIGRSLSPQADSQTYISPHYPAYSGAPLVAATPTFAAQYVQPVQYQPQSQPMQINHHEDVSVDRNLEQFFPELNAPPTPSQIPHSVPSSQTVAFNSTPSMLSTSDPISFTSGIAHNPNFQPGINQGTTGSMLGWIGRAPTIGQRTSMPTLKVDTNHLAPPDLSPLHRSPSSASSAGSSSRSPRRSKTQMPFGDMHCHYCNAAFNTQGDLTHHLRSHQPYLSRNHVCTKCNKRFQYRKDLMRHLPRHDPNRPKYYCPFHGCKYNTKGFGRQDHLDRHVNTQHNRVDSPHDSRSRNNSSQS